MKAKAGKKPTAARRKDRIALSRTTMRKKKTAKLKHLAWDAVEREVLTPLFERQLIVGQEVMLARIVLRRGCVVPMHSHVNEQVSTILEGTLKFFIDNKQILVGPGEILAIPPNMPHKAEAMTDVLAIDIFTPPRADWINKTDAYLRKR